MIDRELEDSFLILRLKTKDLDLALPAPSGLPGFKQADHSKKTIGRRCQGHVR